MDVFFRWLPYGILLLWSLIEWRRSKIRAELDERYMNAVAMFEAGYISSRDLLDTYRATVINRINNGSITLGDLDVIRAAENQHSRNMDRIKEKHGAGLIP